MSDSRLHQLSALGQSVWIDFLSREMLQTGELERLMRDDAVVGITSNPTIFQKAISQGDLYDEQIRASLAQVEDPKEIFWRLAEKDVGDACDVLRPIWDEGQGQDGYVSIEHFGASAPGTTVLEKFGYTPENIASRAQSLLERRQRV